MGGHRLGLPILELAEHSLILKKQYFGRRNARTYVYFGRRRRWNARKHIFCRRPRLSCIGRTSFAESRRISVRRTAPPPYYFGRWIFENAGATLNTFLGSPSMAETTAPWVDFFGFQKTDVKILLVNSFKKGVWNYTMIDIVLVNLKILFAVF